MVGVCGASGGSSDGPRSDPWTITNSQIGVHGLAPPTRSTFGKRKGPKVHEPSGAAGLLEHNQTITFEFEPCQRERGATELTEMEMKARLECDRQRV